MQVLEYEQHCLLAGHALDQPAHRIEDWSAHRHAIVYAKTEQQ